MLWNLIIAIEHVILLKIYLSVMFPDSAIREKLYMGKDKARYLIIYCIFPAFREKLKSVINDSPWLSISFDESPNRNQQKCHMGVNLRYWNNLKSVTRGIYWFTIFLTNCHKSQECLSSIPGRYRKWIPLSCHGCSKHELECIGKIWWALGWKGS